MKKLGLVTIMLSASCLFAQDITKAEFISLINSKTTVSELNTLYQQAKTVSDNRSRRAAMYIYPRLLELGEYEAAVTLSIAEKHFNGYVKAMVAQGKREEAYLFLKGVSENVNQSTYIRRKSALYASRLVWKNPNLITSEMVILMSQIPKNAGFSNGETKQSIRTISMVGRRLFTETQYVNYFTDLETNYKPASFPNPEAEEFWASHVTANVQ